MFEVKLLVLKYDIILIFIFVIFLFFCKILFVFFGFKGGLFGFLLFCRKLWISFCKRFCKLREFVVLFCLLFVWRLRDWLKLNVYMELMKVVVILIIGYFYLFNVLNIFVLFIKDKGWGWRLIFNEKIGYMNIVCLFFMLFWMLC